MRVNVKPVMLRWARERAGVDTSDLARRFPQIEAWEQGMKLSLWLSQQPPCCHILLIISSESSRALPANGNFTVLAEPLSLCEFSGSVRKIFCPSPGEYNVDIQQQFDLLPSLPTWSGEPLHEEYMGYWSPYSRLF